jgi:hypothetical protein
MRFCSYCHVIRDYRRGFYWYSDLLDTFTLVTTNNYDSLIELHTPKITVSTAHMKPSQSSLAVAW